MPFSLNNLIIRAAVYIPFPSNKILLIVYLRNRRVVRDLFSKWFTEIAYNRLTSCSASQTPRAAPRVLKRISFRSACPRAVRYCMASQNSDRQNPVTITTLEFLFHLCTAKPKGMYRTKFNRFPTQMPRLGYSRKGSRMFSLYPGTLRSITPRTLRSVTPRTLRIIML